MLQTDVSVLAMHVILNEESQKRVRSGSTYREALRFDASTTND